MTRYLTLAEYLWLAEQVTGSEAAVLAKASRVDLADSALHAPSAGFGAENVQTFVWLMTRRSQVHILPPPPTKLQVRPSP